MKDPGGLKYFLGMRKHVLDLLTDIGMLDCKPADTAIVQNHHLGEYPDQVPTNKERYQRLVGILIYLSHTRPDIAYAVRVVSQFMHSQSAPEKDLCSQNWAGNVTDRKSTSAYFTFVGEPEFKGMTKGICELLWLRKLLTELGYKPTSTMNLFCDNKAAIAIAQNPVQHDLTKHVEVDRHFIKQKLEAKLFQFPFMKSEDQLADILTQAIFSKAFHNSLDQLGIGDIYAPTMVKQIKIKRSTVGVFGTETQRESGELMATQHLLVNLVDPELYDFKYNVHEKIVNFMAPEPMTMTQL
ncbi:NB-ARC domain-containing disease resistance protein, partial [Prunus dulcis]